ncbi:hypothetical protein POM88_025124 [Heracleum sosnowskyi]|uniref:F-box domain-containing protein n=1 Tax=Heracleum sosnowskyi TaxID=360622 RepID=A0AAD8I4H6_9APIA|nr:hypothetical protein POM88_025124 [Heracleum sosnowskyi]
MENKEKKTTIKHIHESILILILCYLPVDSIIRCRSVCKNWATFIFSQYFSESYSLSATRPLQFLLNADSVVRCRSVCKNWATLIFSQCFAKFYALSATRPLQFLLPGTVGCVTNNHKNLFLADLDKASVDADNVYVVPVITKSVLPGFAPHVVELCSTCNLTGFVVVYPYGNELGRPYHIFNPVTSQHIVVVQQSSSNKPWKNCALLLAHKTNQLKLLMRGFYFLGGMFGLEIQTIGTGSWRTLRNSSLIFDIKENFGFPCFLNGIYHWPSWIRKRMVCLDPDEEVLHCIPTPDFIEDYYSAYLGILDDCLCICTRTVDVNDDLEFWVMKDYGVPESWIKKLVIPNNGIIPTDSLRFLNYGKNVVLCDDYNVTCYNPITGNRKFITYYVKSATIFWYVPIPFVPNFIRFVYGRC